MRRIKNKPNGRKSWRRRRGSAAVECAFCLPVVVLIMFGTLEICSGVFLKETLTVAAYEGCRIGVRRRATRQSIIDECNSVLAARGVTGATVEVTPEDFTGITALTPITVVISAPTDGNSKYLFSFMSGKEAAAEVTMVREFDE